MGDYLEAQAKMGKPITYSHVIQKFPSLPPLSDNWKSHPLCSIFGELDDEDTRNSKPFRTALVCSKELGRPGEGFFTTIETHRAQKVLKSDEEAVWLREFVALTDHYQK